MKEFDLEKVYDDEIAPLMAKIIEVCQRNELPFVAEFMFKNDDEDGEQYCSSVFIPSRKTHGESEHMEALWKIVKPRSRSAMNLTVRNSEGEVTEMITIL